MALSLRDVVSKYSSPAVFPTVTAGSDETSAGPKTAPASFTVDRVALRNDLNGVIKANKVWFQVCVFLLLALFIATLALVIVYIDRPALVKGALSALGISSAGVLTLMIKLWRIKSYTEILLLMAVNMDEATMRAVVDVIAKRLP